MWTHSPFLHYPLVPSFKKINIVNTGNQNPPEGGTWLPVFPILIFVSGKPADNAKMVNILCECRKKSHRKKSHGKKVTDLGRKKSHRKKCHKNKIFYFSTLYWKVYIIISIITNII